MKLKKYDVVVVGAGPAGSTAADTSAKNGLDVLLLEKRQEIGVPVRCAEGVGKEALKAFIEPDKRWICAEAKGAHIYSPDGTRVTMSGSAAEVGYVLERKIFDRVLVQNAARQGAEVMVKTMATGLIRRNGYVSGVKARYAGDECEIDAEIVIGADGVESKVGRWAGIDTSLKLHDIETCIQFLMTNIHVDQDYCEFFLGNEVAPGGYAWIFPKGDGMANVGLGIAGDRGKRPIDYLKKFALRRFPDGKIVEMVVGGVPVSRPIECIKNGLMLVGDAARQANPITGGGIANAVSAGRIAGEVAVEAISKGDVSINVLRKYEEMCRDAMGKTNERMYKVKELIMKFTDGDLNTLAHSLEGTYIKNLSASGLLVELVKRNPKILSNLRHLF